MNLGSTPKNFLVFHWLLFSSLKLSSFLIAVKLCAHFLNCFYDNNGADIEIFSMLEV